MTIRSCFVGLTADNAHRTYCKPVQFIYSGENGVKSEAAAATGKDDVIPVSDGSDTDHKKAPAAAQSTSPSQKSVKKEVVATANDKSMNEVLVCMCSSLM